MCSILYGGEEKLLHRVLDFFFPPVCAVCNNLTDKIPVCSTCWLSIKSVNYHKCEYCGKPVKRGNVCKKCSKNFPSFSHLNAIGFFNDTLKDIIHIYKYKKFKDYKKALTTALLVNELYPDDLEKYHCELNKLADKFKS